MLLLNMQGLENIEIYYKFIKFVPFCLCICLFTEEPEEN